MLRPLDPRRLEALSREGDSEEELEFDPYDHIGMIRELITEDEDWAQGVLSLLQDWPVFAVSIYRKKPLNFWDKKGPDDWSIKFHNHPFRNLRLQANPGGVIDIYAFDKHIQSFQIIGCRRNWPAMILWIWDYGNKLEAVKSKQQVSGFHKRSHGHRRCVEKPLLHQVLHPAKLKTQREKLSKAKSVAVSLKQVDLEIEDVDTTRIPHHAALDTEDSNGQTRMTLDTNAMSDGQATADITVEDIDIGVLDIVDHKS